MSKYTEDRSVEQSAITLFLQLKLKMYNAYDVVLDEEGDLSVGDINVKSLNTDFKINTSL